jgi:hypothetical protein
MIYANNLQDAQVSHLITVRYPGANYQFGSGYQAVFGTRVFAILKGVVNSDERNIMLQLFASENNPIAGGLSNGG